MVYAYIHRVLWIIRTWFTVSVVCNVVLPSCFESVGAKHNRVPYKMHTPLGLNQTFTLTPKVEKSKKAHCNDVSKLRTDSRSKKDRIQQVFCDQKDNLYQIDKKLLEIVNKVKDLNTVIFYSSWLVQLSVLLMKYDKSVARWWREAESINLKIGNFLNSYPRTIKQGMKLLHNQRICIKP